VEAAASGAAGADAAAQRVYSSGVRSVEATAERSSTPQSVIETLRTSKDPLPVRLRRIYLCGEETRSLGVISAKRTISLLQEHPGWTAVMDPDGTVALEERIDDLSPACKESAVFGVDKEGNLSLFDGPPERNKVLRTFFQLDVTYMESSLPPGRIDALERGIRVTDVDEFNSVLSSFADYALEESRKVMKPTF
ncbi:hypothetical protein BG53_08220, partial [Paenibacillus darwinianus]